MQPSEEPFGDRENPYAAPPITTTGSQTWVSEDPETVDFRVFVGAKADYYLGRWAPLLKGWGGDAGFNWAAFFLSGLWLPYRKMYMISVIFLGIILLESVAEDVLFVGVLGWPETPAMVERLVGLVASLICGTYGNRWYLSHARKRIAEVKVGDWDRESQLRRIARRGGTSVLGSLIVMTLFLVVTVAVFAAWEIALNADVELIGVELN
jgi:hypothetical protein